MTKIFGIIGDPIAQARSPAVFNALFQQRGVDAVMVPMHVAAGGLGTALSGLRQIGNVSGLVITVPHKPAAASLLQSASPRVQVAGAANALRPGQEGWDGDLFDGEGFALGLATQGFDLAAKHCSIVGAGGAGAAIAVALAQRGVASLAIWDVDREKASALVERVSRIARVPIQLRKPDVSADIAVNATPVGMQPDDPLPIDVSTLRTDALVAEAIMKPPMTRLLLEARAHGCTIHEGRHMLDSQIPAMWKFFGLP
jgi:shikimate dehydrogenase